MCTHTAGRTPQGVTACDHINAVACLSIVHILLLLCICFLGYGFRVWTHTLSCAPGHSSS